MPNPIGLTIPITKGTSGYFETSEDILTQVKNNFINLILTVKGERLHNPEFGCDIHKVVFEQNDDTIEDKSRIAVDEAVETWMPYLDLEEFRILNRIEERDRYRIQVYFKYRLTNSPNIFDEVVITI